MRNDEAINWLKLDISMMKFDPDTGEEAYLNDYARNVMHAEEMAIEALKAQKVGKWDVESDCEGKTRTLIHKECGFKSNPYVWKDYNFCPECGARMEGQNDERRIN